MPDRREQRRRVLMLLEPQLERYDDIELLILEDNCKRKYGPKLQAMVDIAQGDYISFIDDDDLVSERYVELIYPHLNGTVDCVGFTGHISINDGPIMPVFYSIKNKIPENRFDGYYRYVQHVNPIKRSIIQQVPYDGHFGADTVWSDQVSELNLLNVEAYVPEVMYMYLASTTENREVWDDGLGD
jgi:hypothetical protein